MTICHDSWRSPGRPNVVRKYTEIYSFSALDYDGAVMTVFFGPVLGLPEPFTTDPNSVVALIMDGPPAVALSLDPPRPGVMREPPRAAADQMLTLAGEQARFFSLGSR